jgi:chaperonin GroES
VLTGCHQPKFEGTRTTVLGYPKIHEDADSNPPRRAIKLKPIWKGVRRMATKLTPLHDRIVVRRVEEAETTRGGIIIPDSAKDKPQEGEVMAVGRGKTNDEGKTFPLDVKAGDRILFGKYAGTEIKIDGEDFLIMREEEVLGILEGASKPKQAAAHK